MKIKGIYKFKTDIIVGKMLIGFSSGSIGTYDSDLTNSLSIITISVGENNVFELEILPISSGKSLDANESVDYFSVFCTSVLLSKNFGFFLNLYYTDTDTGEEEDPLAPEIIKSITAFSIKNNVINFIEPHLFTTAPQVPVYANIRKIDKNKAIWISGYSSFVGGVNLFARIISSSDTNVVSVGGEHNIESYSVIEDDNALQNKGRAWVLADSIAINSETVIFSYFRNKRTVSIYGWSARILVLNVIGDTINTAQSITIVEDEANIARLKLASSQGKVFVYRERREEAGLVNNVLVKRFLSVIEPPAGIGAEVELPYFYQMRAYLDYSGDSSRDASLHVFENYIIVFYIGSQVESDISNINISLIKIDGDDFEQKDTIVPPYGNAFSGFNAILQYLYIVDLKKGVFCVVSLNSFVSDVSGLQINPFFFVITIDTTNDKLICSDAIEIKEYQNYFEKDSHGYLDIHKIKD